MHLLIISGPHPFTEYCNQDDELCPEGCNALVCGVDDMVYQLHVYYILGYRMDCVMDSVH